MTTIMTDIRKEIFKWTPFVGKCAIIESTSYNSFGGNPRPLLNLQRNILKDVKFINGKSHLCFGTGEDIYAFGVLGCFPSRGVEETMFEPSDVRVYAKMKIQKDKRFVDIARNKDKLEIGQLFMRLVLSKSGFSVELVTLSGVSLSGIQFSGNNNIRERDIYGAEEIEKMLDVIQEHSEELLGKRGLPKIMPATPPMFSRFIVNLLERKENGVGLVIRTKCLEEGFYNIEDVKNDLDVQYSLLPLNSISAIIVDTKTSKTEMWSR